MAKNFSLVVLVLALGGLGFFSWLQHRELEVLQQQIAAEQSMNASTEKSARAHSKHEAVEPDAASADDAGGDGKKHHKNKDKADAEDPNAAPKLKAKDRQGWRAFAEMAGNPNFEALTFAQTHSQVGRTYGMLFRDLNLPADKQAELQTLLAQRQQAMTDAVVALRENGMKSKTAPTEFNQATQDAIAPLDAQIHQLLGDASYSQYQDFQATVPIRNLVGELQTNLANSGAPLADDQAAKLVALLAQAKAATTADNPNPAAPLGTHSLLAGGGVAKVTDTTVNVAQQVLTAPQVQALQQIRQDREVQNELDKLVKGKPPAPVGGAKNPGG